MSPFAASSAPTSLSWQGSAMLVVFADEGAWLELTHGGISTMSETGVSTRIR